MTSPATTSTPATQALATQALATQAPHPLTPHTTPSDLAYELAHGVKEGGSFTEVSAQLQAQHPHQPWPEVEAQARSLIIHTPTCQAILHNLEIIGAAVDQRWEAV